MYQRCYEEVLEDDQGAARRTEYMALDKAVMLLTRAAGDGQPAASIEALHYTRQLWTTFARELASPENALPQALRASLISIAIWILKEAEAIRLGRSTNYGGIADICGIVRDGLR